MRAQRFSFGRLSDVDIRLLRVFATIVGSGGFAAAQVELDAAASTISTHMANLERRLGLRLCSRGRGGFRLTDGGRVVYEETQKLFAAIEQFGSSVAAVRGELIGELRIGMIDNSILDPSTRIPGAIFHFTERNPDVHISVEVLSSAEIESAILEGKLDTGIGVFQRRRPGITYVISFSERLDLYCGRDHRLFARAPDGVSEADLAEADYAKGAYLPGRPADAPAFVAHPGATAYQAEGLAFLIQSGRFIGYLPRRYAAIWVERDLMRPLLPGSHGRRATFHIVTRKGVRPTLVLRAFLEELKGQHKSAEGATRY